MQRSASKGLACEFLLISSLGVGFLMVFVCSDFSGISGFMQHAVGSASFIPVSSIMAFGRRDSIVANLAQTRCPKAGTM